MREGLRDFSISRAAVSWGIPVPRDPHQTVYVWFDALNGYLSGGKGRGGPRASGGRATGLGAFLAAEQLPCQRREAPPCPAPPRPAPPRPDPPPATRPRPGLLPKGAEPSAEALAAAGWPADVHVIGKVCRAGKQRL